VSGGHRGNSSGSCVGQLGCLAFIGLGWLFLITLPYSGYSVLGILALLLLTFLWKKRQIIIALFRDHDNLRVSRSTRQGALIIFAVVAGILTYGCFIAESWSGWLWICLVSAVLWTVVLHLATLDTGSVTNHKKLIYFLLANGREFAFTVSLVLVVFIPISLVAESLPLDNRTVITLMNWETQVEEAHLFLESLKFSLPQLLMLVLAFWALRTWESHAVGVTKTSDAGLRRLLTAGRWIERGSLVLLIASSITFLATNAEGPVARISAQIRDSTTEYAELQRMLREETGVALENQAVRRALAEKPPLLRDELENAQKLLTAREELAHDAKDAYELYHVRADMPETDLLLPGADQRTTGLETEPTNVSAVGQLSPREISALLGSAKQLKPENFEPSDKPEDELMEKTVEKLLPAERLTDHVHALAGLTKSYPVFGELLNVVATSLADTLFARSKKEILRRVSTPDAQATTQSMRNSVLHEAAAMASKLTFDWSEFSSSWGSSTERSIEERRGRVAVASATIRRNALNARNAKVKPLVAAVRANVLALGRLGDALADHDLSSEAKTADRELGELRAELQNWPVLGAVPSTMLTTFHATLSSEFEPLSSNLNDLVKPVHSLELLSERTNDLIVTTIGSSNRTPRARRAAQQALGSRFVYYESEWQLRVEEARRIRAAEIAREQQEEEARRERQERELHEQQERIQQEHEHEHLDIP
jgi:hypothetical protein